MFQYNDILLTFGNISLHWKQIHKDGVLNIFAVLFYITSINIHFWYFCSIKYYTIVLRVNFPFTVSQIIKISFFHNLYTANTQ